MKEHFGKKILLLIADILLANLSFILALLLMQNFDVASTQFDSLLASYVSCVPQITISMMIGTISFGLLVSPWNYDPKEELLRIFVATMVGELFARILMAIAGNSFSLSIYIISALIFIATLVASRTMIRFFAEAKSNPVLQDAGPEKYENILKTANIPEVLGVKEAAFPINKMRKAMDGKVVLLAGASGELSTELARCLAHTKPRRLILLDRNEKGLSDRAKEIENAYPELDLKTILVDLKDEVKIREIFKKYAPHIVINACLHSDAYMISWDVERAKEDDRKISMMLLSLAKEFAAGKFVQVSSNRSDLHELRNELEEDILKFDGVLTQVLRLGEGLEARESLTSIVKADLINGQKPEAQDKDAKHTVDTLANQGINIVRFIIESSDKEADLDKSFLSDGEVVEKMLKLVSYEEPKEKESALKDNLNMYRPLYFMKK